jgi:hypothetical protein
MATENPTIRNIMVRKAVFVGVILVLKNDLAAMGNVIGDARMPRLSAVLKI